MKRLIANNSEGKDKEQVIAEFRTGRLNAVLQYQNKQLRTPHQIYLKRGTGNNYEIWVNWQTEWLYLDFWELVVGKGSKLNKTLEKERVALILKTK